MGGSFGCFFCFRRSSGVRVTLPAPALLFPWLQSELRWASELNQCSSSEMNSPWAASPYRHYNYALALHFYPLQGAALLTAWDRAALLAADSATAPRQHLRPSSWPLRKLWPRGASACGPPQPRVHAPSWLLQELLLRSCCCPFPEPLGRGLRPSKPCLALALGEREGPFRLLQEGPEGAAAAQPGMALGCRSLANPVLPRLRRTRGARELRAGPGQEPLIRAELPVSV